MSIYNQKSFGGGLNLKVDDTRLDQTQYRTAFNCRCSTDTLVPVRKSIKDTDAPSGLKQGMLTFGPYVILFIKGQAWYREHSSRVWNKIAGFKMSDSAPRFWWEIIPISITNYRRQAAEDDILSPITSSSLAALSAGNTPGLLVQDNINQPQFIFIQANGSPIARTTQTFEEWDVNWDIYIVEEDKREYVPIGNAMSLVDGVLWIVSPTRSKIYRSVTGRPLDFVIIVDLVGERMDDEASGGAEGVAYSVGVPGITTVKALSDGSLFVGADGANFAVSKNMTPGAQLICGEYTFTRRFLFNARCLNQTSIIDTLGDTRFIDLNGIRSFNAVQQLQIEGQNSVFTSTIVEAFRDIIQDDRYTAAITFNNDDLYAVQTVFGPAIAIYDAIQEKWAGFDIDQTEGKRIKFLAKIESNIQKLYAIAEDDTMYQLYASEEYSTAYLRTNGINSAMLASQNPNLLQHELKPVDFRCILSRITEDVEVTLSVFTNNRLSSVPDSTKLVKYTPPINMYTGPLNLPELTTKVANLYWTIPNAEQGWKVFFILSWSGGAILTQLAATFRDETPMNPLLSQL